MIILMFSLPKMMNGSASIARHKMKKRVKGNLILEGIPAIPTELHENLIRYQNTREARLVDWLPDGDGVLIATRFGEVDQVHHIVEPGKYREQLTFFSEPVFGAKVRPTSHKKGFLFLKDIGGSEMYQVFYQDMANNNVQQLTSGRFKNAHLLWNHAGNQFAYASTRNNQIDHHVFLHSLNNGQREQLLFEGEGYWYPIDWSGDDEWLTIGNYQSISKSSVYLLHINSGELIPVGQPDLDSASRGGFWDKNDQGVFFTSDDNSQFQQLYYFNLSTRTIEIISKDIPWDVEDMCLSPNKDQLVFCVNNNGISELYLLDIESREYSKLNNLPIGFISNLRWHPTEFKLGLTINTSQSPADVYVMDLTTHALKRWTYSEVGGLTMEDLVEPTLIHYDTFDEEEGKTRQIPAFYYRPKDCDDTCPVLIYIHGGPESQYRPVFSANFQYYLNELGIAVIAPNVRGSTGYGKHFLQLDNGYKREDSVKDIGSLLNWIEQQPDLDRDRVAVMGGSYGGYMVLASMTHYNEHLRCGIDVVGISNFITFLENTEAYRKNLRRVEYGDERDPNMRKHLEKISPLTNAHKITKPMLIIQGLNDPRVPASEAEQMLEAIRNNGGEAWYLLAKDEGHGFKKKTNRDIYLKSVILFLRKYLLDEMLEGDFVSD